MSVRHPQMLLSCRSRVLITMGAYALISSACAYLWSLEDAQNAYSFLRWANKTLGQPCTVEQMPYIAYASDGSEFIYIASRCVSPDISSKECSSFFLQRRLQNGCRTLLATLQTKVCMQQKAFGESCTADKE